MKSTTKQIEDICSKVSMPNDSTTNVLGKLFGSSKVSSVRKCSFDPSSECIVASNKVKKATNLRIKPKN